MARANIRILIVEDEPNISEVVRLYLQREGYEVDTAANGGQALALFAQNAPQLVVLDLMLPDIPGEQVCEHIRASSRVPIIMLTAKTTEEAVLGGLAAGADDYITKPFSPRQLVARVNAVLRRANGDVLYQRMRFDNGRLDIDAPQRRVRVLGEDANLTPSEMDLLLALAAHPKRVLMREDLIRIAFGQDYQGFDRTVDSHIKNLRQKIESDPRHPRYIHTVRGTGYRFDPSGGEA